MRVRAKVLLLTLIMTVILATPAAARQQDANEIERLKVQVTLLEEIVNNPATPAEVNSYIGKVLTDRRRRFQELQDASMRTQAVANAGTFWTGKAEVSSAFTVGTQTQETLSGRLALAYVRHPSEDRWLRHTITAFDVESSYGAASKKGGARIMTTQMSFGSLTQNFIKSRTTIFPFALMYHNFSQGMRLEQAYGLGVKYSFRPANAPTDEGLSKQIRHNFVIQSDLRGIHENFSTLANSFTSAGVGIAEDDSFHLGPATKPTFIFQEHIEFVPAFKSARALQARAVSTLTVPLTKRVNLSLQFNDFYVRNAPTGHRQNYSKTSFGFGYILGKR